MTAHAFLGGLNARGIKVSVDGERLIIDAPSGALSAIDRAALAENKAALIVILSSMSPASWNPRPAELATWTIPRRERWGRRANELQGAGLDWEAAERQAFAEVKGAIEREGADQPGFLGGSDGCSLPTQPKLAFSQFFNPQEGYDQ